MAKHLFWMLPLFLCVACSNQSGSGSSSSLPAGPTAQFSASRIDPSPPDSVRYEKAIGLFTSTSYPSYYLATDQAAYIYDTHQGTRITIAVDGDHDERARSYYASRSDTYQSLIAAVGDGNGQVVAYVNPANANGGNPSAPWTRSVIYGNSGCHNLYVVDLDGDGLSDVACSGNAAKGTPSFSVFQNSDGSWTGPVDTGTVNESIALLAVNGVNGGARTNTVGCNGTGVYWYQNPGGSAARNGNWQAHYIGDCNQGVEVGSINVGGRDIVLVGSGEVGTWGAWPSGLAYFDPGNNPFGNWTKVVIDRSYQNIHEIACDTLNGIPFCTVAEQEQSSSVCNTQGLDSHPAIRGCRVAVFPWTGNGFASPTIVSNLGSHNQTIFQLNGVEYMAGANHGLYGAVDPAFNLWTFTLK